MRCLKQVLVFCLFLAPAPALAWGPQGHEIVAHLAAMHLTPKARAEVAELLGGEAQASMAIAANWADEIRDLRPQTARWHYVNLEIDGDLRYDAARDCPRNACAVGQILRDQALLRSRSGRQARAEALKFLIHLVGDIHQPLHAADHHDRGGNDVRIAYRRGRPLNLHQFWDGSVLAPLGRDPLAAARRIDAAFGAQQKTALMADRDPAGWAMKSAAIARTVIYRQTGGRSEAVLTERDVESDAAIARLQLAKAGYALAGMLNAAFR
jgi:hypothetical protein